MNEREQLRIALFASLQHGGGSITPADKVRMCRYGTRKERDAHISGVRGNWALAGEVADMILEQSDE